MAAEEGSVLQAPSNLSHQLLRVITRRPTGELDVDVRLVQRNRDQLQVPGPAEVGGDDGQFGEVRRHRVQVNRPSRVELDALAAGLARAGAAGAGVKQTWELQLRGLLPELEMALITRIEVLHPGMELRALRSKFRDGPLELL